MYTSTSSKQRLLSVPQPWKQGEKQSISNFGQGAAKTKLKQLTVDTS